MAYLSDDQLFSRTLPDRWRPILESLHDLEALATTPRADTSPERRRQASLLRAKMLPHAGHLYEDFPQSLRAHSPEYRRWFTEALVLWPLFAEAGGDVLTDTIGTTTLRDYPVDFRATAADRDALRRATARTFGWTLDELEQIEARLAGLTLSLRVKKAVARHLSSSLEGGDRGRMKSGAVDLMRQIYGPLPWHPGDVDLVITGTTVFLCIPYEGLSLTIPDFAARPAADQEAILRFLQRVQTEQRSLRSIRFPAFGIYDSRIVAPELIASLAAAVRRQPELRQIDERFVSETFRTMVTVLPTPEIDKYLVHDVWGHVWQETLCEFEQTFRDLPRIGDPIGLAGGSPFAPTENLSAAFVSSGGRTVLRPGVLLHIVESDLRGRIVVGLNLVVSELLADLIEYKFMRHVSPLPSSSLLLESPLCLDLSLNDTRDMIHLWRRPYRSLLNDSVVRLRLQRELAGAGVEEAGLPDALDEAAILIETRFGSAFEDTMPVAQPATNGVRANLLQRIMLGIVALDAAIERFVKEGEEHFRMRSARAPTPRWHCPTASIDLLALLLGWFYEQERALHLWHLDEFVTTELTPALLRLEVELEKELS